MAVLFSIADKVQSNAKRMKCDSSSELPGVRSPFILSRNRGIQTRSKTTSHQSRLPQPSSRIVSFFLLNYPNILVTIDTFHYVAFIHFVLWPLISLSHPLQYVPIRISSLLFLNSKIARCCCCYCCCC